MEELFGRIAIYAAPGAAVGFIAGVMACRWYFNRQMAHIEAVLQACVPDD